MNTKVLGTQGESVAVKFLKDKKYKSILSYIKIYFKYFLNLFVKFCKI